MLPLGIAVSPNEDTTALADFYTEQVQLLSGDLVHKCSLDTTQGLEPGTLPHPREVAFGSDSTCYVAVLTRHILMYDDDGVYKGKWPAVSPQDKSSDTEDTELRSLTIDSMGQVLVGEVKQKYISKHKPDGRHVASFKVDIVPFSLAVTSQNEIIISDWKLKRTVHIVDSAGQLLHIVKPPSHVQIWRPAGVACYENTICICNWGAKRIHCFSASGEYLGDIPISIPSSRPKQLAFTSNGKQLMVINEVGSMRVLVVVYKVQDCLETLD